MKLFYFLLFLLDPQYSTKILCGVTIRPPTTKENYTALYNILVCPEGFFVSNKTKMCQLITDNSSYCPEGFEHAPNNTTVCILDTLNNEMCPDGFKYAELESTCVLAIAIRFEDNNRSSCPAGSVNPPINCTTCASTQSSTTATSHAPTTATSRGTTTTAGQKELESIPDYGIALIAVSVLIVIGLTIGVAVYICYRRQRNASSSQDAGGETSVPLTGSSE
ncbi:uncharacterized protein LOC121387703 isoform X2 [Gigantopelta aegis]|uniref:uncharacterized protein LOC121387703 isoform X2 n=1 Tax=Gigantopelta aegis TaxID=1735272 RepID=UPI001B88E169|nr:uncharacterized protein LOC121387703 isoform X2 [Gigantopelta aegis]